MAALQTVVASTQTLLSSAAVEQDLARGIPKRTTRKLESRLKWGTVAPIRADQAGPMTGEHSSLENWQEISESK